ncbi:MAG TPA: mechanosensitive ion channel domain-containing protein [Candidatus Binatia bacterium]|nr:mechanosensitive ion channel domain-containing protein [Candidatus Binatia bacterium]
MLFAAAAPTPSPGPSLQGCQNNPIRGVCTALGGDSSAIGPLVQRVLGALIIFALVLIAGYVVRRIITGAADRAVGDAQVRGLARNVITILTWLLAVIGGLVAGGLDAAYVFTFGGIFSLAIGLAFQDLLRNVLAGIFILIEKPFQIGDRITVTEQAGIVHDIALRTTVLHTDDGRIAVVPNLLVFQNAVLVGQEPPPPSVPAPDAGEPGPHSEVLPQQASSSTPPRGRLRRRPRG